MVRRALTLVLLALLTALALPAAASAAVPANTALPSVGGNPLEGQALTSDTGTWTGTAPIAYARRWLRCDRQGANCVPLSATGETYTVLAADVGSTLRLRVEGRNSEGVAYASSAATAVVTGTPPVNTAAPEVGGIPRVGQVLTVTRDGTWSGTQPYAYSYAWRRCDADGTGCVAIAGATSKTYTLTDADLGFTLRALVTNTSPAGRGEANSTPTAAVGVAEPPGTQGTPTLTGVVRDGDTLRIDYGTWTGAPTLRFTQTWSRCDALGTGCLPIPSATGVTYALKAEDVGRRIQATVTVSNSDGTRTSQTPMTDPVAPRPPDTAGVPSITGATRVGQTLTAAEGSWNGTAPITYAYRWLRCDAAGGACVALSGAEAKTYTLTGDDLDARLKVTVTGTNAGGSAMRTSAPTAAVTQAQPPVNTAAPTVSGLARDGQTQTAAAGTWTGVATIAYTYQWLRCDAAGDACAPITGATTTTYKATAADADRTVRVRVRASNPDGFEFVQSAAVRVAPAAPANTGVPALTGAALDGARLTVGTGAWTGTPELTYTYAWERCDATGGGCATLPGATGASYELSSADLGLRLRAKVTATNAAGTATAGSVLTQAVEAAPPVNTVGPTFTGIARDGQVLSAERGTWTGTDPVTYAWQWLRCGPTGAQCQPIAGATSATYRLTPADVRATIRVRVDATNRRALVSAQSAAGAVVVPAAPAVTSAPAISGQPQDGAQLTATPGTWSGTPTITFAYEWLRCAAPGDCSPIPGATSQTYRLTVADIDSLVSVRVLATNAATTVAAESPTTAAVDPVAPSLITAPSIGGTARDGQTLTAATGTWSGSTPRTQSLQWRRCDVDGTSCADLPGETGTTYKLTSTDVGRTIRLAVTTANAAGSVTALSTRTSLVAADPPANPVAATITGVPRDGLDLTVEEGVWTGSPAISYSYQWQRCTGTIAAPTCADVDGAASRSYRLRTADVGSMMRVRLTGANAAGHLDRIVGPTGLVQPHPPVNATRPVVSGIVRDGEELTATAGTWTGVITFAYGYQWYRCNEDGESCGRVAGATQPTFTLTPTDVGLKLRVEVTARNAGGSTAASSDATVVGTPRPPAPSVAPRITGYTGLGQTMTADDGGWIGSPPLTFRRQWLRCDAAGESCAPVAGATGRTFDLTAADLGHRLRVRVQATNAAGTAELVSSPTRVVSDDPPVNRAPPSISTPSVIAQGVELSAAPGEWIGAGPLEPSYRWRRCDATGTACADIPGAMARTYVPVADDLGLTLRVAVTMDNGVGAATATSPARGPVLAAPPVSAVAPTVSANGILQPGTELSAKPGSWTGADPITYAYRWLRCNASGDDCTAIPGAGATKYLLTDADIGFRLRVRVAAANATLNATADSSPLDRVVALVPSPTGKATVTVEGGTNSKPKVGAAVRGDGGAWAGTPSIVYSYRWQRCASAADCADIPGAESLAYTFTDADVGSRLRLVVVARNVAGSAVTTSALTEPVAGRPPAVVGRPTVSVAGPALREGAQLTAEPGTWSGTPTLNFSYQWQRCAGAGACKAIAKAVDRTYTTGSADVGQRISVLVTAGNPSGKADAQSAPTDPVSAVAPVNRSRPAIQRPPGKLAPQAKLNSTPGTWAGSEKLEYAYQWLRCERTGKKCRAIEGATKPVYDLQEADFRSTKLAVGLRVAVTVRNAAGAATANSLPLGRQRPAPADPDPSAQDPSSAVQSRVALTSRTARFDRRGRLVVRLICAKGGPACAGRLNLTSPALEKTVRFSKLRPGRSRVWTVTLSRAQQRAAGRTPNLKLTLTATVTGEKGKRVRRTTVRVPRPVAARWARL